MCLSILVLSTVYNLPSYIYTIYALVELRDAAGSAPAHGEAVRAHALRGEGDVVGPQRHGAVHCRRVLAQLTLAHLQILLVGINICNISISKHLTVCTLMLYALPGTRPLNAAWKCYCWKNMTHAKIRPSQDTTDYSSS